MICNYNNTCPNKTDNCQEVHMNGIAKPLIPNKEWIVENEGQKLGTLTKNKNGYIFFGKGTQIEFHDLNEVQTTMGIDIEIRKPATKSSGNEIHGYPCKMKPYNAVFDVKNHLPLYTKSEKSQSQHCAGHYIIKFPKGWVRSFSPKLITLQRYPYKGPWKTELESKVELAKANRERH